jgi:hypothetical protein
VSPAAAGCDVPVDRRQRMGESVREKRKRPQREGGKPGAVPDQSAPQRWAHPTIPRVLLGQWFPGSVLIRQSECPNFTSAH